MGAEYGIVGGIGYAVYWLCIPLTGYALYRLRRKFGAKSMVSFLTDHYGVAAAFCFSAAILVRLFNEVWSNTSVVGAYYGSSGSAPFIIAALLFTAITVAYCCWGGMRGSLTTDVGQTVLFAVLFVFVLIYIVPQDGVGAIATSGVWSLEGGVDFIIGAGLQCLSYGFHDAVLTDRGFICRPRKMLRCMIASGLLGFLAIMLFSTIGIHAYLNNILLESDAPVVVAQSFGVLMFFAMAVIMIATAGSTLDSTFTALAKLTARDLPGILGRTPKTSPRIIGIVFMIIFGIVVGLACVTTAIGLTSSAAAYFTELCSEKVPYKAFVIVICVFSAVASNLGLDRIVSIAAPVLVIVYPPALVVIFISLIIPNANDYVSRGAALGAVGASILCAFKVPAMENLPLYDMGLYWILPAVIFGLLALGLAAIVKPRKSEAEAKI